MVEVKSFSGTQLEADIHLVRARSHFEDMIHVDVDIKIWAAFIDLHN